MKLFIKSFFQPYFSPFFVLGLIVVWILDQSHAAQWCISLVVTLLISVLLLTNQGDGK